MTKSIRMTVPRAGENVLAASRQMWLATLGAASVTREWAGKEAGPVFRTLVAEGASVESKLVRRVGRRLQENARRASTLLRHARRGLESSAQTVANAAASLARRTMPRLKLEVAVEAPRAPRSKAPAQPAARARKAAKSAAARKTAKAPAARKRRSARRVAAK